MTSGKVWFLSLVAALGGFLFGFDTIVINGAEQDIQRLWSHSACGGGSWRAGDRMRVHVAKVDFRQRRIDFVPVRTGRRR